MFDLSYGSSNIVEVFCSWVKDRPDHTAVIEGGSKLSFAGLFDAAKALAAKLWACGTGKGDVVLIIGRRSSCFIEEVVAVLMTGAAFTSVDEAFPRERQETICGQVNARVILKDREILD
ncbi:MAG: AMP-binding protein, partial [Eubacteriales bacterium]|nr:AMP-binding protein [Eubacteriales bacterium]